jgi:hypothetical protein
VQRGEFVSNNEVMSAKEIHDFGIEIVVGQLTKDGYEILSANTELGMNPQVVANRNSISLYRCADSLLPRERKS